MTPRYLQLGASLYVPATRPDLAPIASRDKFPFLRSVIFCTEDAVAQRELPRALTNIEQLLQRLAPGELLRFVRVRNPAILRTLLQMGSVEKLTGFVLPKFSRRNLDEYLDVLSAPTPHAANGRASWQPELMMTLETIEAFDPRAMIELCDLLLRQRMRRRILSLRIGGNDLFQLLGMRRPRGRTLYGTALGVAVSRLVTVFRPHGFNLTAPVFDYLDSPRLLQREVRADLAHGLFGKTAIHPKQVPLIEEQYKVSARDLQMAEQILTRSAPPVFRVGDAMCEPATHRAWARLIDQRARLYGVAGPVKAM
ncbi:MAG: HpcH/HpaI aldolase/citrate lyase family protein [Gemmataceae bacterium]|nr:HpcH/HpaI aldolase/citrate lyase family protein [Gemmataceae bacterium]